MARSSSRRSECVRRGISACGSRARPRSAHIRCSITSWSPRTPSARHHPARALLPFGCAPTAFEFREDADGTTLVLDTNGIHFGAEYTIALIVFHLRAETAGAFAPERIDFVAVPDDGAELEQVFGCPVRGGAPSNCVVVARRTWNLPLTRRDAALRTVLEEHPAAAAAAASLRGVPDAVRHVLAARVNGGDTRIESVARGIAMSPRSLQRKLAEESVTYHALVEEARAAAAARHLSDRRLSISEIGCLLGYSEPAAFTRAFKRWHGISPLTFRAKGHA
jgi:AraC-like DNA-binding protein